MVAKHIDKDDYHRRTSRGHRTASRTQYVPEIQKLMAIYYTDIEHVDTSLEYEASFAGLANRINDFYQYDYKYHNPPTKTEISNRDDDSYFIQAKYLCQIRNNTDNAKRKSKEKLEVITHGLKHIIAHEKKQIISNEEANFSIPDWYPDTTRTDNNPGADFLLLPLKGQRFKQLTCTVYSNSQYYRFGLKLIGGATFGERTIQSFDDNIHVHTGVGSMDDRHRDHLFTALYLNGNRAIKDGIISRDQFTDILPTSNQGYDCKFLLDEDDFLHFNLNGKRFEKVLASRKVHNRVAIFSWADRVSYEIEIKNIRIETRSP